MDYFWLISVIAGLMAAFLHEVGHYLAARIMGIPVSRLTFGMGKRVLEFRVKNIDIQFCAFPFGGQIYILPEYIESQSRYRIALVSAGGFIMNVILAGISSLFWVHLFAKLFCLLNVVVAVFCLFPDKGKSDGERIITFLLGKQTRDLIPEASQVAKHQRLTKTG
jgi:membrane-associated protease RseP (regulator of RpoE activity)